MKAIEGYEISERLGTSVFLVERGRRHAALKLLPEDACEPDAIARCFTAACEASALRRPGIARVYDVGVSAAGGPFIVSELLAGESLARRLARGPLPLRRALDIARQIARTVAAAHDQGVAHGALEPDHILLFGDRVRLINFGVAHLQRGAPSYAAPEQCGATPAFDEHSDLYALGRVLAEMIAGRPALPEVRDLVAWLLEKDRLDRPSSAAIVAALLAGLLRLPTVTPTAPKYRPRSFTFSLERLYR